MFVLWLYIYCLMQSLQTLILSVNFLLSSVYALEVWFVILFSNIASGNEYHFCLNHCDIISDNEKAKKTSRRGVVSMHNTYPKACVSTTTCIYTFSICSTFFKPRQWSGGLERWPEIRRLGFQIPTATDVSRKNR